MDDESQAGVPALQGRRVGTAPETAEAPPGRAGTHAAARGEPANERWTIVVLVDELVVVVEGSVVVELVVLVVVVGRMVVVDEEVPVIVGRVVLVVGREVRATARHRTIARTLARRWLAGELDAEVAVPIAAACMAVGIDPAAPASQVGRLRYR